MKFNMSTYRNPQFLQKRADVYAQKRESDEAAQRGFLFKEKLPMFKSKEGENVIRILPWSWDIDNPKLPWLEAYAHYKVGPDNATFWCANRFRKEPCFICEQARLAKDRGEKPELIKPLYPKRRGIVWLIDRDNSGAGPQVWTAPYPKVIDPIFQGSRNRKTGAFICVDDIKEGFDIAFTVKIVNIPGADKVPQYEAPRIDRDPSPLHTEPEIIEKWMDAVMSKPTLEDMLVFYPYDHIKSVLCGTDEVESEEESETHSETVATTNHDSGNSLTVAKLNTMTESQIVEYINQHNLDVQSDLFTDNINQLRGAVALELGLAD